MAKRIVTPGLKKKGGTLIGMCDTDSEDRSKSHKLICYLFFAADDVDGLNPFLMLLKVFKDMY